MSFYDIVESKLDDANEVTLVGKTNIDSMLDESGFGAATKMGGFVLERPRSILVTRTFLDIHIHFISIFWGGC